MARSYRTQKRSRLAERRLKRDVHGNVRLARIIERRPYPGDTHPLQKGSIRQILNGLVPLEYSYGLKRIELRARNAAVGEPYGLYLPDEKAIILYSLPGQWVVHGSYEAAIYRSFHAHTEERDGGWLVRWPSLRFRALWFAVEVFFHELGHHHRNQYRFQHRRGARFQEEILADFHALRLWQPLLNRLRKIRHQNDRV